MLVFDFQRRTGEKALGSRGECPFWGKAGVDARLDLAWILRGHSMEMISGRSLSFALALLVLRFDDFTLFAELV